MFTDGPVPETPQFRGPMLDHRGRIPKKRFGVDNAESLGVLTAEWVFFTPAPLYLFGRLDDAFLIDYMFSIQKEIDFYYKKFDSQIFSGLSVQGDASWNHVLWTIPTEYWDSFVDFICSLSIADRESRSLWRFGLQELTVIDPIAINRAMLAVEPPTVTVYAFGLYGNKQKIYFENKHSVFLPPRIIYTGPDKDDIVFADAYFNGVNPFDAKEKFSRKGEVS